ncbi:MULTISPECIES: DUF1641 domain-containing protein [Mycolicibacterium]|uniref:DUF1641 domain-containing protein n=1 Tax=Mycolicibacterium vanbaalenii (strain DSM 7251 / JCM 13017 / BCRC 16820 / KCTC 9966 / NRRL B-24157 / PYR-1) TaxID=350058 RepID=A1T7M8_MYCVP|nr:MULTISPECIES: DUF1641 domain-containing protein [Mycolicibacterium]ABM13178.1 hypothetical protein Mvan_2364 [Mycolicibacterium vanbaalenii PYR-1]MCV7127473.1 DUF1641 domain-containing protein [Mycolicibacterium vanbaalenii PYR-1]QZY48410.1 DUF1641 domain-containing protein [Mycolicibacterium austroafricanum]UJL26932.1 DUF1641 domain-containing protein [Mycolicibacterium vanbaalenii]WND59054.1 DUF1641 domain-containing protein [Mycolicibacterium vanbaalenii]
MNTNGGSSTPVLDPAAPGPSAALRDRLDDPRVAEALDTLLEHADLLAVLVTGLDGFVRRGDDITANLTSAIGELKGQTGDLGELSASLAVLTSGLVNAAPAISTLLNSSLTKPQGADVVAALGDALVSARQSMPAPPRGVRGVWKTLRGAARDPDVTRGLVYLLEVARAFGRRV